MTTDTDHESIRNEAQSEVHEIAMDHVGVSGYDQYTRQEADATIGKSWSNMATIYVRPTTLVGDVMDLLESLADRGYLATIGTDDDSGLITIEVSMRYDAIDRLENETDG